MMGNFKERYERIRNSPEFKRQSYVRQQTGLAFLISIPFLILLAYLLSKFLGISEYATCTISAIFGYMFAVVYGEKRANPKFGKK